MYDIRQSELDKLLGFGEDDEEILEEKIITNEKSNENDEIAI